MASTFVLGIEPEVNGSSFLSTEVVYQKTGQNLGNLAFHYAMHLVLNDIQQTLPWHSDPKSINKVGRIGILPCANNLGPHADFGELARRFEHLEIPLVAVGLGAQGELHYANLPSVPEGSREWVRQIAKRSSKGAANIGVRGPFTMSVLRNLGLEQSAVVLGCPTLFINPDPKLGVAISQRAKLPINRIAVAAGHYKWRHLAAIEKSLVLLMEATGGSYIVQSPQEMVALGRGEVDGLTIDVIEQCRSYMTPWQSLEEFKRWSRRYVRAYFNVSDWMEQLRGHDFIIGTRIHGVMLGLQAGIPSMCIVHDSRTRELCETLMVPFVMANEIVSQGITYGDLKTRFVFDGDAFDQHRRMMSLRFQEFLKGNNVDVSDWLENISRA